MSVDGQDFRDVMACVAMPVAVVSTIDRSGVRRGATVGSLASLSVNPALIMFALGHGSGMHRAVCESPRLAVSILTADQQPIAERFAGARPAERFAQDTAVVDGLPVVETALGWLICSVHKLVEAGDHTIVVAGVERAWRNLGASATGPLLYHERRYHRLPFEAAMRIAEQ